MLPFQRHIFSELCADNSLLILGRGLGLDQLIHAFVELYARSETLVLLINGSMEMFERLAVVGFTPAANQHFRFLDTDTPSAERSRLYQEGGVLVGTSRIFLTDMLTDCLPTALLAGLLVIEAQSIADHSNEAFIIRLFRERNHEGFIKAFSDCPEPFTAGFAHLEKSLRTLHLKDVQLWPRFHMIIAEDIDKHSIDLVEYHQPLSPMMETIQRCIIEIMDACLQELRRANPLVELDEFVVENALLKSFDYRIKRLMAPVWHRVSFKSKTLLADMKLLRRLLDYLLQYDCVSFNSFLETVVTGECINSRNINGGSMSAAIGSPWMVMEAAETLFKTARQRVINLENHGSSTAAASSTRLILEANPKWELLESILDEITNEILSADVQRDIGSGVDDGFSIDALIMVSDERTAVQLADLLAEVNQSAKVPGGNLDQDGLLDSREQAHRRYLTRVWSDYQAWKQRLTGTMKQLTMGLATNNPAANNSRDNISTNNASGTINGRPSKRLRRTRGGGNVVASATLGRQLKAQETLRGLEQYLSVCSEENNTVNDYEENSDVSAAPGDDDITSGEEIKADDYERKSTTDISQPIQLDCFGDSPGKPLRIFIRPYGRTADSESRLLRTRRPSFVVVYDPKPAFVRELEIYKAQSPQSRIRVYFLFYENSVEEQRYLTLIRREKEAFEKLIRTKSQMAVQHEHPDGRLISKPSADRTVSLPDSNSFTRLAGGNALANSLLLAGGNNNGTVIVDVRELRSQLPFVLHSKGRFKLVPVTIEVGDYILTPDICVERKSIGDLISSFNSGRLYSQVGLMSKHYKTPVLLIEFEEDKVFSFNSQVELCSVNSLAGVAAEYPAGRSGGDGGAVGVMNKLVLLTIHYPQLRILWSGSPQATADIFFDLKANQSDPTVEAALSCNMDSLIESGTGSGEGVNINFLPVDLIQRVPGLNGRAYMPVIRRVHTLLQLSQISEAELTEICGNQDIVRSVREFFEASV